MSKAAKQLRTEALARLHKWLKPGDTVHTVLRHVSRSGMQRTIDLVICAPRVERGETCMAPHTIGWTVARALDMRFDRDRCGIKIDGCGMDMGFALVYNLGRALWPNGVPCIGERCRSNDHNNGLREACEDCGGKGWLLAGEPITEWTDGAEKCETCRGFGEKRKPFPRGADVMHRDGGYALRQVWL